MRNFEAISDKLELAKNVFYWKLHMGMGHQVMRLFICIWLLLSSS